MRCTLDREVNVLQIALSAAGQDDRADQVFATGSLPAGESGWLDLDLIGSPGGVVIHQQATPWGANNILGTYREGFRGLPTVGLVMQEFFNANVGGAYGNTGPLLYEQVLLPDGS